MSSTFCFLCSFTDDHLFRVDPKETSFDERPPIKYATGFKIYFGFSLQKPSLQNVSNSSQIIQGSLVGPISVYFRNPWPKQGPQEGPETIFWPFFNFVYFPQILLNEWFYWIFCTLLNEYLFEWIFCILFWIEFCVESFLGWIQWKNEFSKKIAHPYLGPSGPIPWSPGTL